MFVVYMNKSEIGVSYAEQEGEEGENSDETMQMREGKMNKNYQRARKKKQERGLQRNVAVLAKRILWSKENED